MNWNTWGKQLPRTKTIFENKSYLFCICVSIVNISAFHSKNKNKIIILYLFNCHLNIV